MSYTVCEEPGARVCAILCVNSLDLVYKLYCV